MIKGPFFGIVVGLIRIVEGLLCLLTVGLYIPMFELYFLTWNLGMGSTAVKKMLGGGNAKPE
jgi:hypothetical protein